MKKDKNARKIISIIFWLLGVLVFAWFLLLLINYYLVRKDGRPVMCWNYIKEVYDEDEYTLTCNGIFYKYREYYYNDTNRLHAREFTLFFKDFKKEK